jgi:hypothetical protein
MNNPRLAQPPRRTGPLAKITHPKATGFYKLLIANEKEADQEIHFNPAFASTAGPA